MKNFLSNPDPDGCGPYGRHLTGAVDWQKYYEMCPRGLALAAEILVNGTDWATPVPPPSEALTISAIRAYVSGAGTASFIRYALYDCTDWANKRLIADSGEAASDTPIAIVEIVLATPVVLQRNGRYLMMICGRGAVLPTLVVEGVAGYARSSWLGQSLSLSSDVSRIKYTRAYAAFPAIYNGVYASDDSLCLYCGGKL